MTTSVTTTPVLQRRGGRLAVCTAVAGTVLIALGAFWLSFTALADLARRSGISEGQAWAWPLIVDGIIVVATVSVVALAGHRAAWYPWMLLAAGALVSVTANALHAVIAADADVPGLLAAAVAAVPPLVLLAITHLTVILTRPIAPNNSRPRLRPLWNSSTKQISMATRKMPCGVRLLTLIALRRLRSLMRHLPSAPNRVSWTGERLLLDYASRAGQTSASPHISGCTPRPWGAGCPNQFPSRMNRRHHHEYQAPPSRHS